MSTSPALARSEVPQTVEARLVFWQRLHDRLAKLANRVDATAQAKIFGDIHAKIPMVMLDEQRGLQLRNAESDEQFWTSMRGMAEDNLAGHQENCGPCRALDHGRQTRYQRCRRQGCDRSKSD